MLREQQTEDLKNMPNRTSDSPTRDSTESIQHDLQLAQDLCEKVKKATLLRKQKSESLPLGQKTEIATEINRINAYIVNKIQPFKSKFEAFIKQKVFTLHNYTDGGIEESQQLHDDVQERSDHTQNSLADDVVREVIQIFIEKRVLQSNTFCNYRGLNNSSLLNYLHSALEFVILTYNEEIRKKRLSEIAFTTLYPEGENEENDDHFTNILLNNIPSSNADPVGNKFVDTQTKVLLTTILRVAIKRLKNIISDRDMKVFLDRLSGISYDSIARDNLDAQDLDNVKALKKEADKVRKSYSRSNDKLTILMTRLLLDRNLQVVMTEFGCSFQDLDPSAFTGQQFLLKELTNRALLKMSAKYPQQAKEVATNLDQLSCSKIVLQFGKIGDSVITPGKTGSMKLFQGYLDSVLEQRNMIMTIDHLLPTIKNKENPSLKNASGRQIKKR